MKRPPIPPCTCGHRLSDHGIPTLINRSGGPCYGSDACQCIRYRPAQEKGKEK